TWGVPSVCCAYVRTSTSSFVQATVNVSTRFASFTSVTSEATHRQPAAIPIGVSPVCKTRRVSSSKQTIHSETGTCSSRVGEHDGDGWSGDALKIRSADDGPRGARALQQAL